MNHRERHVIAFREVRPQVLERDENRCIKCGSAVSLEVHHVEGYQCNDLELMATLCWLCHCIAPMGKAVFDEWLARGDDGLTALQGHLERFAVTGLSEKQVRGFCEALEAFGHDSRVSKFRAARAHMRQAGIRCEGRMPYGLKAGEDQVLRLMLALRADGLTTYAVAAHLNDAGIATRTGKPSWRASTVGKILLRAKRVRD